VLISSILQKFWKTVIFALVPESEVTIIKGCGNKTYYMFNKRVSSHNIIWITNGAISHTQNKGEFMLFIYFHQSIQKIHTEKRKKIILINKTLKKNKKKNKVDRVCTRRKNTTKHECEALMSHIHYII
jgi:hypothetical protein